MVFTSPVFFRKAARRQFVSRCSADTVEENGDGHFFNRDLAVAHVLAGIARGVVGHNLQVCSPDCAGGLVKHERERTRSVFVLPMRCKNPCTFVDQIEV